MAQQVTQGFLVLAPPPKEKENKKNGRREGSKEERDPMETRQNMEI